MAAAAATAAATATAYPSCKRSENESTRCGLMASVRLYSTPSGGVAVGWGGIRVAWSGSGLARSTGLKWAIQPPWWCSTSTEQYRSNPPIANRFRRAHEEQ